MAESEEQKPNRPWLFQKGRSGNPGGRPKGSGILPALRGILTPERAQAIAEAAVARAEDGDARLLEMLLDRIDGPVKREVEVSGALSLSDAVATFTDEEPAADAEAG